MVATAVRPDFLRTLAESNRDAAGFYDRKAERYEGFRQRAPAPADGEEFGTFLRHYTGEAVNATRGIVSVVEQVEDIWAGVIRFLKIARTAGLAVDAQVAHLRDFVAYVESAALLFPPVSRLWAAVGGLGGDAPGAGELTEATRRLNTVNREASRAIEARVNPWQPRDKERFETAMRRTAEGNVTYLTAEEFKARMRRGPDEGAA